MRTTLGWACAAVASAALVALATQAACVSARLVPAGSGGGGAGGSSASTGGAAGSGGMGGAGGQSPGCVCDELDVLLVIDNSDSLDQYALKLAAAFAAVSTNLIELSQRACSYHFGVVTSTPPNDNPAGCDVLGALSHVNASHQQCNVANGVFATEVDDIGTAVYCLAVPGTQGNGNERPIEAMFTALSPSMNAAGACNEGFFRPNAPLLLLIISDVDDTVSAGTPAEWYSNLVTLNGGDETQIASLGVIGPIGTPTMGCNAGVCTNLHAFLLEHNVDNEASANICEIDMTNTTDLEQALERMGDALCPIPP